MSPFRHQKKLSTIQCSSMLLFRQQRPMVRFLVVPILVICLVFSIVLDWTTTITATTAQKDQTTELLQLGLQQQQQKQQQKQQQQQEEEENSPLFIKIRQIEQDLMQRATQALSSPPPSSSSSTTNHSSPSPHQWDIISTIHNNTSQEYNQEMKQTLTLQNLVLPPPSQFTTTNSTTIILVMSTEYQFTKRQAIRETWRQGHDNVYFVIGHHSNCQEKPTTMTTMTKVNDVSNCRNLLLRHAFLYHEQEMYHDLLQVPPLIMNHHHQGLSSSSSTVIASNNNNKLIYSYQWMIQHLSSHIQWFVTINDDMFVRVSTIEQYLEKYNPTIPLLIGKINNDNKKKKNIKKPGRNAERKLRRTTVNREEEEEEDYSFWPQGNYGYIVSRTIAKYIAKHDQKLVHYQQGEEEEDNTISSLGIWLQEAVDHHHRHHHPKNPPLDFVTYVDASTLITNEGPAHCADPSQLIVGHDLTVSDQVDCYRYADEGPREKAYLDRGANFKDHTRTHPMRRGGEGGGGGPSQYHHNFLSFVNRGPGVEITRKPYGEP